MLKEDYKQYYIPGSDHYLIPKDVFIELFNEMNNWKDQAMENNKYKTKLINKISENIDVDPEDYYFAEIEEKSNKYDKFKLQQNEFIKFLEDNYEQTQDIWYIKILNKYLEIIGVENESTRI